MDIIFYNKETIKKFEINVIIKYDDFRITLFRILPWKKKIPF